MNFRRLLKNHLRKLVKRHGHRLEPYGFLLKTLPIEGRDWRHCAISPIELKYLIDGQFSDVMFLPLWKGRGLVQYPLVGGFHPFRVALAASQRAEGSDSDEDIVRVKLGEYYRSWQPASVTELWGLTNPRCSELTALPPTAGVPPWIRRTWREYEREHKEWTRRENLAGGLQQTYEASGTSHFGPVSAGKLNVEVRRLHNLYRSMRPEGYRRDWTGDGDVGALILQWNDGWRWHVASGEHRAAVAASLGYKWIPVRVKGIVDRIDVKKWPNVKNGTYSATEALSVFDRIFLGNIKGVSERGKS